MTDWLILVHDDREISDTLFTDLSKGFNYLSHDLLPKWNEYELDQNAASLTLYNHCGRSQKTKVGFFFQ